jgi:hypothetical protein
MNVFVVVPRLQMRAGDPQLSLLISIVIFMTCGR